MEKFSNFQEDLPLLVEAGLVAVKQGDEDSAKKIFNAVGVLDPKNTSRKIGLGLVALNKMELSLARKYFQEVLDQEPDDHRTSAFLGFSYMLSAFEDNLSEEDKLKNLKEGTEIAMRITNEKDAAEDAKRLANSLLDWEREIEQKAEMLNKL